MSKQLLVFKLSHDNILSWQQHIEHVCKKIAKGTVLLRASYRIFPMSAQK